MRVFFDTNVLLYRLDYLAADKQRLADDLISAHYVAGTAHISTQVLQEFYSIAVGKLRIEPRIAAELARGFARATVIQIAPDLIFAAMDRHAGGQFSFWDALIVEAALVSGAELLYSDDMQDGLVLDGLTIRNPFTT